MTSLYKHYDSTGKLLYVGIANNVIKRLGCHRHSSEWHDQIARIDVTHYPSRQSALNAEREAIKLENPPYNITHSPTNKQKVREGAVKISEADVAKYPLVVAERDEIPKFYNRRWGLNWIADHFGTTLDVVKYVLRQSNTLRTPELD